jgi:hypothetical protein
MLRYGAAALARRPAGRASPFLRPTMARAQSWGPWSEKRDHLEDQNSQLQQAKAMLDSQASADRRIGAFLNHLENTPQISKSEVYREMLLIQAESKSKDLELSLEKSLRKEVQANSEENPSIAKTIFSTLVRYFILLAVGGDLEPHFYVMLYSDCCVVDTCGRIWASCLHHASGVQKDGF